MNYCGMCLLALPEEQTVLAEEHTFNNANSIFAFFSLRKMAAMLLFKYVLM